MQTTLVTALSSLAFLPALADERDAHAPPPPEPAILLDSVFDVFGVELTFDVVSVQATVESESGLEGLPEVLAAAVPNGDLRPLAGVDLRESLERAHSWVQARDELPLAGRIECLKDRWKETRLLRNRTTGDLAYAVSLVDRDAQYHYQQAGNNLLVFDRDQGFAAVTMGDLSSPLPVLPDAQQAWRTLEWSLADRPGEHVVILESREEFPSGSLTRTVLVDREALVPLAASVRSQGKGEDPPAVWLGVYAYDRVENSDLLWLRRVLRATRYPAGRVLLQSYDVRDPVPTDPTSAATLRIEPGCVLEDRREGRFLQTDQPSRWPADVLERVVFSDTLADEAAWCTSHWKAGVPPPRAEVLAEALSAPRGSRAAANDEGDGR